MITDVWNTIAAGEQTTLEQRARSRLAAACAADSAREAMDLMHRHGGSALLSPTDQLARYGS